MDTLVASIRITVVAMLICVFGYTLAVLGISRTVPGSAEGSLITASDGTVVGSRLIAQPFTEPGYFWPRPSAVGYNAAAAGGSNQSPTSRALGGRAADLLFRYGATVDAPLPAELAAASGSGLDPHISLHAALYQVGRVARARQLPREQVESLVRQQAFSPGGALTGDRLLNVLDLNLALDARR